MSLRLAADTRKPRRATASARGTDPLGLAQDDGGEGRPPIWVEGRQAPAFAPGAFAQAGVLLARDSADQALTALSQRSAAWTARLSGQDWSALALRLGRAAPLLPQPATLSRLLALPGSWAQAAQRLLYGQPDPVPTLQPAPVPDWLTTPAPSAPRHETPLADPDLAAIRDLLKTPAPPLPARPEPAAFSRPGRAPLRPKARPINHSVQSAFGRFLDWLAARVLAGTVLGFALPFGLGKALYRHLDGQDLREIAEDCLQKTPL